METRVAEDGLARSRNGIQAADAVDAFAVRRLAADEDPAVRQRRRAAEAAVGILSDRPVRTQRSADGHRGEYSAAVPRFRVAFHEHDHPLCGGARHALARFSPVFREQRVVGSVEVHGEHSGVAQPAAFQGAALPTRENQPAVAKQGRVGVVGQIEGQLPQARAVELAGVEIRQRCGAAFVPHATAVAHERDLVPGRRRIERVKRALVARTSAISQVLGDLADCSAVERGLVDVPVVVGPLPARKEDPRRVERDFRIARAVEPVDETPRR